MEFNGVAFVVFLFCVLSVYYRLPFMAKMSSRPGHKLRFMADSIYCFVDQLLSSVEKEIIPFGKHNRKFWKLTSTGPFLSTLFNLTRKFLL